MTVIYKYQLRNKSEQEITIPKGAQVIHVGVQDETICLWAIIDTDAPDATMHISIYGTGTEIADIGKQSYLGTVHARPYIFHIFRRLP